MGESPTRQSLQPEATGATVEATKWLKPPVKCVANRRQRECAGRNVSERRARPERRPLEKDVAQADPVTLSGKADTIRGLSEYDPDRCAGVVATACTQGKRTQHGKPLGVVWEDQPNAREGGFGRSGVAARLVVPGKSGNAGGGKGPQFKTDAGSSKGPGDWET